MGFKERGLLNQSIHANDTTALYLQKNQIITIFSEVLILLWKPSKPAFFVGVCIPFFILSKLKHELQMNPIIQPMKKIYLLPFLFFFSIVSIAQPCTNLNFTYTSTESRCVATGTITVNVTGGSGNYNYKANLIFYFL